MRIPFAVQSYTSDSLPISSQRCVNAFAEAQPQGAKYPVAVFGTPGTSLFVTVGVGPIRGMYAMNGVAYAVSGGSLYSIASDGTTAQIGSGIPGGGVVSMDGNGFQICIVNGTNTAFIYDTTIPAFTQIADVSFNAANTVTFIDDYFAFDWVGTRKIFVSNLLDGTTYNALAFATKESKPDRVVALRNRQNALLVFAENSIETWTDVGTIPFPFQRFDGGTVNRGLRSPYAIAEEDNSLFFLGDDLIFYRLNGTQPVRVSTHALEHAWQEYAVNNDAICFAMNDRGHKFIAVTFPTAARTFVFDIATNLWHERVSYDASGRDVRWRVNCVLPTFGKILVGDANSGRVGQIDPTVYTEFDDPIRTVLISPPIHADGLTVFMDKFELDIETGVGLSNGQGNDPQIMLDWTDDGGHTFVPAQEWRSMGKIGEYTTRIRWEGLGYFYQRSMRVTISDPVKRVVLAARADTRIGTQ